MNDTAKIAVLQRKVSVEGTCSDRFAGVREAFVHNLDTGQDIGATPAERIHAHAPQ
jgi:hypothetical protein